MSSDPTMARGIILAAGRGSRMKGLTAERPKCMIEFRGRPLLAWQIEALRAAGVTEIAAVRGYRGEMLDPFGLVFFDNPRWAETNMVQSLAQAASWLSQDVCIVSYADIFYPSLAVSELMKARADIAMTYDPNWKELWTARFGDPLLDAETLRLDARSFVTDIGRKPSSLKEIEGQYMGLLRFTPAGWHAVADYLNRQPSAAADELDMTALLRGLVESGVAVQGVPTPVEWGEVDNESDLRLYSQRDTSSPRKIKRGSQ
jgi:L-glutamine-phosphate cytidylyltransferase